MNRVFYLASVLKKCGNNEDMENLTTGNRKAVQIVFYVLLGLAAVGLFFLGKSMTSLEVLLGTPTSLFQTLFMLGTVLSVVLLIPSVLGSLYMSDDLFQILLLPYSPLEIVFAKVINLSHLPILIAATVSFPAGIGFITSNSVGISFILALIFAFISIVLVSMSFDVSLMVLIIYLIKGFRNKDHLKIIGAIIGMILLILWIIFIYSGQDISKETVTVITNALGRFTGIFPVNFALGAMLEGNLWIPLLEAIGITAAFVLVAILIVKIFYLNGALSMQDTSSGQGTLNDEAFSKAIKKNTVSKSIMIRDLNLTRRNPAYLMPGYLIPGLLPLIMSIAMWFMLPNMIGNADISSFQGTAQVCSVLAPLIASISASLNVLSCTPISREGTSFEVTRQLPIAFDQIIKGKQKTAFYVSAIPCGICILLGGIIMMIFHHMQIWGILFSFIVIFGFLLFPLNSNMVRDLKKPNLIWESEALMLKNACGVNCVLLFFMEFIIGIICMGICQIQPDAFPEMGAVIAIAAEIILSIIFALTSQNKLKKWTKKVAQHLQTE